jgi:hypothetical protein
VFDTVGESVVHLTLGVREDTHHRGRRTVATSGDWNAGRYRFGGHSIKRVGRESFSIGWDMVVVSQTGNHDSSRTS